MKANTRFDGGPTTLTWQTVKHLEETISLEGAHDGVGSVDADRSKLTHQQKTKNVVEIGACKNYSGYRSVAQPIRGVWVKFWTVKQLFAKVWRRVNQKPRLWFCGDCQLRLSSCSNIRLVVPYSRAVGACAIPLW